MYVRLFIYTPIKSLSTQDYPALIVSPPARWGLLDFKSWFRVLLLPPPSSLLLLASSSTASSRLVWASPDLNRRDSKRCGLRRTSTGEILSAVGLAGPQRLEKKPERISDRTPDRMSNRLLDGMPAGMPDRMPDKMSERMPDRMPDRMSERMPDKNVGKNVR